jgi:2-oxoglutarate ferredoxin oxidoreductase subunit alpha
MVNNRAAKIAGIRPAGASFFWTGPEHGDILLLGWGGTYGSIKSAAIELRKLGVAASACQVRYLNPLPEQLGSLLKRFTKILVPELNSGQFAAMIRAKYLIDAVSLSKVRGQPFAVAEIMQAANAVLAGKTSVQTTAAANAPAEDVEAGG